MKVNYLIVGQGIAGSVLAFELMQQGKKVVVVDSNTNSTSSKVAAGLYNPIVFKRIVKSWMVDEVLPVANEMYAQMEQKFHHKFHHKRAIIKLFASADEREFWFSKAAQKDLSHYLSQQVEENFLVGKIQNEFGAAAVLQSGNCDVRKLLEGMLQFLRHEAAYREEHFTTNDLSIHAEGVTWKEVNAEKIIFCEGYLATQNSYFSWLPFVLTKGEVLTIHIPNFDTESVLNKGVFFLPLGNQVYKVGATYEWNDLTEQITEQGKQQLLQKIQQVLTVPFSIVAHESGIRPTVKDRRPIIGLHPEHSQIGIFNGMGTKAILLAPYYAQQFAQFLAGHAELNPEIDIARFKLKS
ncbi:MAG: FAD-binding oxidoreductase [Bacteroidetes bacterium]|nr:FAD-binding oxidoreductase [Bacteroidota bacterium]